MQRSRARYSTDMRQSWDNLQQHADKHKTACQYNGSPRTVCGSRSVAHHHGAVSAAVIESTCIHMRKRRAGQSEGHGATSLRPRWAFPVGITRRASSRACGAVRGGRRPPGSSRWGGWVREGQGEGEVLRRAEEALCGRVGVWVGVWAGVWAGGAPGASGRAASPSRGAASVARASSCPVAAAASRSDRPARPSRQGSSRATAAAAVPPSVAR